MACAPTRAFLHLNCPDLRVLTLLLKVLGRLLAALPEGVLRVICAALGEVMLWTLPKRRRVILSNLDHAFPERDRAWQQRIARESCRRLVETGLLSLASPFLSERRLRMIAQLSPDAQAILISWRERPRPVLVCTPHFGHWETQTWLGLLSTVPLPEFGVIFRPLRNASVDAFVKRTRERFGMRLLSRKDGFQEALKILRRNGTVGLLFDQNAGDPGALSTLFGRIASTTELAGLMAEKYGADVVAIYPHRTAFWRVELRFEPLATDGTVAGVTLALNRWLESALTRDDNHCASWLWSHDRWRAQHYHTKRFKLEAKRDFLAADLAARGWTALPKKTRVFIRLPNWLGDVVMALPLLRALRAARPDAELTLIGKGGFEPLVRQWDVCDVYEALPPRGRGYFRHFHRLRLRYPDTYLLFTNSFRGDVEAWLTRAPQRFGLVRPGKRRPLLTHAYTLPADYDEAQHHQLSLWTDFLAYFGLQRAPDTTARTPPPPDGPPVVGLICGSENTPAKRWPVPHWRALIEALPDTRFVLFGTPGDRALTTQIAAGLPPARVEDLAGKTDLPAYIARLRACHALVSNDTGGLHLANALGVPVVGLFGPTNPVRTGPVFAGPTVMLQPPGCPPTGGGSLENLAPATVADALREVLAAPPARN